MIGEAAQDIRKKFAWPWISIIPLLELQFLPHWHVISKILYLYENIYIRMNEHGHLDIRDVV